MGGGRGIIGERRGRVVKEHVKRTHRQRQCRGWWDRIEGGRWVWVGWGRVVGVGKWRQLYLNNN